MQVSVAGSWTAEPQFSSPARPPMGLPGEFAAAGARQIHVIHPGAGRPGAALHRRHDAGRCPGGTEFGLERFTGFIIGATAAESWPPEELRLLIHAIP